MRTFFLLSLCFLFIAACEKTNPHNPDDDPDQLVSSDYFPLSTGSFWIYQNVDIDPLGVEKTRAETDSVIITGDTLINGKLYSVFEGTNYPFNGRNWGIIDILRDSAGYIVNHAGEVKFSFTNFSDTLYVRREIFREELLYTLTYMMQHEDLPITVPAGEFEVKNFIGTVLSEKEIEGIPNPRYLNNYYAEGVGNVLRTYLFFNSPKIIEKRLLRYHIPGQ